MELINVKYAILGIYNDFYENYWKIIPAENIIIKAIPTIKATERHPIITNKSTFQGLNTESAFFGETLAKKGSTFDDGIFLEIF